MKRSERRAEYERLLRRREREGLSDRQLAAISGAPIGTLTWWSQRLRGSQDGGDRRRRPRFVELVPRDAGAAAGRYEIQLLLGSRLLVEGVCEEAKLARLVAILEQPC